MSQRVPDSMPAWDRPLRVPEAIEITHTEPPFAIAGERSAWRLPFVLSREVRPGSVLRLQLVGGRNNKGRFDGPAPAAHLADGIPLDLTPDASKGTFVLSTPQAGLKKGDVITVTLAGCQAPTVRQLNKLFILYATSPEGGGPHTPGWAGGSVWAEGSDDRIVAVCTMHVLGAEPDRLRAYAPSFTEPGAEVAILVRAEDRFGNLSHQTPGELSVSLGGREMPARFEGVEGSTCVRVVVTLAPAGIHRLRLEEKTTGREATTNPVACGVGSRVLWGMIHGHTEMSDGTGTLAQYFHQLRNDVALDFAAPGDHDHRWETPDAFWERTQEAVKHWHEPGRFVTLLGYEWAKWRRNGDGDRNVYYLADDRPLYRSDDGEYPSPPDLFRALRQNHETAIVIPHHTGHGGNFCDWKDHDATYERLVEIFQVRGSYECSERDGNPVPEHTPGVAPYEDGYVRQALALGWRVGFTAGGDDHIGLWGSEAVGGFGYKQGLMCVEAAECSREAVYRAMHRRRVVATTGARMLLTYRLNDHPMGSELSLTSCAELGVCRRLAIEFHGTAAVDHLDIIRNDAVLHSVPGGGQADLSCVWEDGAPLATAWLPATRFCPHPFAFYYVRAVQQDGEVAWASPVWIDP